MCFLFTPSGPSRPSPRKTSPSFAPAPPLLPHLYRYFLFRQAPILFIFRVLFLSAVLLFLVRLLFFSVFYCFFLPINGTSLSFLFLQVLSLFLPAILFLQPLFFSFLLFHLHPFGALVGPPRLFGPPIVHPWYCSAHFDLFL